MHQGTVNPLPLGKHCWFNSNHTHKTYLQYQVLRSVAQPGSALGSESSGRRFESYRSDQFLRFYLRVAQSGQSSRFGAEGSQVQILPRRPVVDVIAEAVKLVDTLDSKSSRR